jgi:RNA polymerase sigma factor (sigma-70 family)
MSTLPSHQHSDSKDTPPPSSGPDIEKREVNMHNPLLKKNFNLLSGEFEELVKRLKAGDETLFQKIFLAHFQDCMTYLKNKFRIEHEVAYDVSMETLLLFRKKLLEGKITYGNIRFLFTQMAGQLYLKQVKKQPVQADLSSLTDQLEWEEELPEQELYPILNKAWKLLCEDCSQLLQQFYYQKASLKEIAEKKNKSAAAIRKQKQRCMEKLRDGFLNYYNQ